MQWINKEKSRCVKAWESSAPKTEGVSSVALAPQGTFLITAKVGDLDERLKRGIPQDSFADVIAKRIAEKGMDQYTMDETADQLERDWNAIPQKSKPYFDAIEVVLVENRSEGLDEIERHFAAPRLLETTP